VARPAQVVQQVITQVLRVTREHWIAAILLAAGLVLRVLVLMAYHPALLYTDTLKYLYGAWSGADPIGYTAILKPILLVGDLGTVALVQHLVGLAIAVAIYALLRRRGVPRWLAAIAMAPVLLDAYQLQIEQTIMPDLWFEALAVAGLVLLLWRPEPPVWVIGLAGLIFGASATVRQVGEILVLPAFLFVAATIPARRKATAGALVLLVAFALPIVMYSAISKAETGHFQLSDEGSIAGRLASSADCATITLPAAERPLCPTPAEQARGIDWLEHSSRSPLKRIKAPTVTARTQLLAGFDSAVEQQQAIRVAGGILRDSVRIFALTKGPVPGVTPISRWRFQTTYPKFLPEINVGPGGQIILGVQVTTARPFQFHTLNPAYGGHAQVDRPIAKFLRAYQLDGGYTPGPLLLLFAVAGLAGSVITLAGRRIAGRGDPERAEEISSLAQACLLFFASIVAVLLISDLFEFSWRYQLPALVMLPPAGVLGAWAVWRTATRRPSAPAQETATSLTPVAEPATQPAGEPSAV
jgi:hypothetical protein